MSTKGKMTGPMFRLPFLYFLFYWILGRNGFVTLKIILLFLIHLPCLLLELVLYVVVFCLYDAPSLVVVRIVRLDENGTLVVLR